MREAVVPPITKCMGRIRGLVGLEGAFRGCRKRGPEGAGMLGRY